MGTGAGSIGHGQVIGSALEMGLLYVHTVLCCNRHALPPWPRQACESRRKLVSSIQTVSRLPVAALFATPFIHYSRFTRRSGGHCGIYYSLLDRLAIPYQRIDHRPRFHLRGGEQAAARPARCQDQKPLFARSEKRAAVSGGEPRRRAGSISRRWRHALGVKRLSFGSPERLEAVLGLTPGSVTLLAMVRDSEHAVELVVDEAYLAGRARCSATRWSIPPPCSSASTMCAVC